MTLPNGIAGISDAIGKVFATTGNPSLVSGFALNPISGMPGLTQNFVTDLLKVNVIQNSLGWGSATNALFDGLRRGDPIGGSVSFTLAIVEQFAAMLLGVPLGSWGTVQDALTALEAIPGIAQLIVLITGAGGTITEYSTILQTWATNLHDLFAGIDLNNPLLNVPAALSDWVIANVLPLIEAAISDVTGIADGWITALSALGLPNPLALVQQLSGSIPALARGPDGGLSAVGSGLTRGVDGGITWIEDGLTHLVQQGDQGLVGLSQITEQIVHAAETVGSAGSGVADVMQAGQVAHDAVQNVIAGAGIIEQDIAAGATEFGNVVSDTKTAIQNAVAGAGIVEPNILIAAAQLGTAVSDTITQIEATWDAAVTTFLPDLTPINPLADFQNALNSAGSAITTAAGQITNALTQLNIRDNIPIHFGLGATHESTISLAHLGSGSTPENFNITDATPAMGFVRCGAAALKKWIIWHGAGKTGITDFYIAVYRMDRTTGDMQRIHLSSNIISIVSAGWNWNAYQIAPDGIQVLPSDVLGIELRTVGSGTHTIAGVNLAWMPDYPDFPKRFGACRNSTAAAPSTIASAAVQYDNDCPFFSIGMDAGDVPSTDMPAQTTHLTAPNEYVVDIHPWTVLMDLIGCGGGGGGGGGSAWSGPYSGEHGSAGNWNDATIVRGVDIPWDTTRLTVTVPWGGDGGTMGTDPTGGGDGGDVVFSATGMTTFTCPGGVGGGVLLGINNAENPSWGSPGDEIFNGTTYPGGVGGPNATGIGASGQAGSAPGGAGGGGNTNTPVFNQFGGDGAPGAPGCAYVVQRQS